MEIPIAMVVLSLLLPYGANRRANIAAGAVMTAVQFATLLVGSAPASYYIFFSVVEIATTGLIAWFAGTWPDPARLPEQPPVRETDRAESRIPSAV
jgi:hypothetical protein